MTIYFCTDVCLKLRSFTFTFKNLARANTMFTPPVSIYQKKTNWSQDIIQRLFVCN